MLKVVANGQEQEGPLGPQTLDELAQAGAAAMLRQALEAEVAAYLERHQARDAQGHALVVRNGTARTAPRGAAIKRVLCSYPVLQNTRMTVASPHLNRVLTSLTLQVG